MTAMRVLVTGGSGFLGRNLVRFLLARGYAVTSLDLEPFDAPEADRIDARVGDIRVRADVDAAMTGVDAVVHCAAALPLYAPSAIVSTDVEGTRLVLQSAQAHGVRRVVHISSTAVYGLPDHHPIREDVPRRGVGPYGEAKVRAEELAEAYRGRGLEVPILRPKSFVGPERLGVFSLLFEWAEGGHHFPVTGSGKNRYQLLDVEDLCAAIELCLTLPAERANDTFNVGAAVFGSLRDDYQSVLDRAGHGKRVIPLPAAPAIFALRILERLRLSPLYAWVYEGAHRDSVVSIEKAERRLGWSPRFSNREALGRAYDWYVANADRARARPGVSHRVPWKQGALRLLKLVF